MPLFTSATSPFHSDLLVTPLEQFDFAAGPDVRWANKTIDKLYWRGSTTGIAFNANSQWRQSQRPRLVASASSELAETDVRSGQ